MIKQKNEFEIISDFFSPLARDKGSFGLSDDVAALSLEKDYEFIVSTDMLVSGVHFFSSDKPEDVASKCIRVNISDIISKGGIPKYYFLSIALPKEIDDKWLRSFTKSLGIEQKNFDIFLMGGDTVSTSGPLIVNIVCIGVVKNNHLIRRNGARPGDDIYVTGEIGSAKIGLEICKKNITVNSNLENYFIKKYRLPKPKKQLGPKLINIATSSIDISDGLISDLNHICLASNVKAEINYYLLPITDYVSELRIDENELKNILLNGGDDYEILFTANSENSSKIIDLSKSLKVDITKIGVIVDGEGIVVLNNESEKMDLILDGYKHR
ncbi:MAG: Thiamine-monophosphate kinase [Alphaproteobacteria bacterium MarineAlpha2_Bin1]|nr:MAG: Thiamine-monophosphate kinase [Alphaproteobacteria bacterium MarineAlpha2_Bin1]|tara:strand:+ start:663 stop:1640 length:978 start_codon:yes stop_codon:yes gene_type:complete